MDAKRTIVSATSIHFVKGVGPGLGAVFQSRGIESVQQLLYFFPRTYENRSDLQTAQQLTEGATATLKVQVLQQKWISVARLNRSILEVRCQDAQGGAVSLKWFYAPKGIEKRLVPGSWVTVTGKVKFYLQKPEIIHPEMSWAESQATVKSDQTDSVGLHAGRVVPIYVEIEGVSSRVLRNVLGEALKKFARLLPEDLPEFLLQRHSLPKLADAIQEIHFPELGAEGDQQFFEKLSHLDLPCHHRLIYEEFFKFEFLLLRRKLAFQNVLAPSLPKPLPGSLAASLIDKIGDKLAKRWSLPSAREGKKAIFQELCSEWEKKLPFRLTAGQKTAVFEILQDFAEPYPMNRLLQGDVGCGKTVVALITAACFYSLGGQVALMVPTEILAEQHQQTVRKLFGKELQVALLTGRTKKSERVALQARLLACEPLLLIGTHALIEDSLVFPQLMYMIVDEQHRFGVEQRRTLREKGKKVSKSTAAQPTLRLPHSLIMTATPIPRTLALSAFGDLSISAIRELPPGRQAIRTVVLSKPEDREAGVELMRRAMGAGRQAYYIFPLVEASEAEGFEHLQSATEAASRLAQEVFPEFQVALLHGQMSSQEKEAVMQSFKAGTVQLLVSTTVIEVGVDVPNAVVMAVEHAERFGLAQLHQLRGRVGRGEHQSYCLLLTQSGNNSVAYQRLKVLEQSQDGFAIAEADLKIRGPGEFLGTKQAGGLEFRMADLVRDAQWLELARQDAMEVMRLDPELSSQALLPLRTYFEQHGGEDFARLGTG